MSSHDMSAKSVIWIAIGGMLTMLLGVNGFFVKNLVEKVDRVESIENRLGVIETKIDFFIKRGN